MRSTKLFDRRAAKVSPPALSNSYAFSRGAAAVNSLGREPQEMDNPSRVAPEGRQNPEQPSLPPLRGFGRRSELSWGSRPRLFTSAPPGLDTARVAYTLMEMMVVISLIAVLAGLSVMFIPQINESARAAEGGRLVQTWLNTAKQRAIRDGVSRGVRFLPQFVTNATTAITASPPLPSARTVTPAAMSGGLGTDNPWAIEVGMQLFVYSPLDNTPLDIALGNQGHPEFVTVTAVTGTTFSATFSKTHTTSTTSPKASVPMLIFSTRCVEAQYIEQADDFTGGQFVTLGTTNAETHFPVGSLSAPQAKAIFPPASTASPTPPAPPPPYAYFPSSIPTPTTPATQFLYFEEAAGVAGVDFSGGFGGGSNTSTPPTSYAELALWPIQPGDYIELHGSQVRRIQNVWVIQPVTTPASPPFVLDSKKPVTKGIIQLDPLGGVLPVLGSASTRYRIIRGPRPMGEEKLILPKNISIDFGTNILYLNPWIPNPSDRSLDVMFAPSGRVVGRQSATDEIFFWIRDVKIPFQTNWSHLGEGGPTLVALRTRSGVVSAHGVDRSNGFNPAAKVPPTPYTLARDGRSE